MGLLLLFTDYLLITYLLLLLPLRYYRDYCDSYFTLWGLCGVPMGSPCGHDRCCPSTVYHHLLNYLLLFLLIATTYLLPLLPLRTSLLLLLYYCLQGLCVGRESWEG